MFDGMSPLLIATIGVVALVAARLTGRRDPITRRAYGKRYSGAPGADAENKPDYR
jgi:hypothetical protein